MHLEILSDIAQLLGDTKLREQIKTAAATLRRPDVDAPASA